MKHLFKRRSLLFRDIRYYFNFCNLITHLQTRTDVQNIDLMNLSGFCRNCLSKWYLAAAEKKNISLDYNKSRELVYGMPYDEWKSKYQKEATEEQIKDFNTK